MNAAYEQGFIDKCAAAGVDPEALIKQAELLGSPKTRHMGGAEMAGTGTGAVVGGLSGAGVGVAARSALVKAMITKALKSGGGKALPMKLLAALTIGAPAIGAVAGVAAGGGIGNRAGRGIDKGVSALFKKSETPVKAPVKTAPPPPKTPTSPGLSKAVGGSTNSMGKITGKGFWGPMKDIEQSNARSEAMKQQLRAAGLLK